MKSKLKYRILGLVLLILAAPALALADNFENDLSEVSKLVDQRLYLAALERVDSILSSSDLKPKEEAQILLLKGRTLYARQKPVQAINTFNKVLDLNLSGNTLVRGHAFASLGELYDGEGSYDLARQNYNAAFKIFRSNDYDIGKADIFSKVGNLEKREKNFPAAISSLESAHQLYTKMGNDLQRAYTAESLALMQYSLGEYAQAEKYLLEAIKVYESKDFLISQEYLIQYLTAIYEMHEEYDNAILYTQKAIETSGILNDSVKASHSYTRLATFQEKVGKMRDAIKAQKKALAWTPNHATSQQSIYILKLAQLYADGNRDADAILSFYDAFQKADDTNDLDMMIKSSRATSKFYASRNNLNQALTHTHTTDSLNQLKLDRVTHFYQGMMANRDSESGETIVISETDYQPLWKRDGVIRWLLITTTAGSLLIIVFLFRRSSQNRRLSKVLEWKVYKRTRDLQLANKELNTYIYKSSHDLRTPLTSIKSLLRLLGTEQHSQTSTKYLGLIDSCTEQMDDILIKLSRAVDYKNVDIKVSEVDFSRLQFELEQKEILDSKGVSLIWDIDQDTPFFSDTNLIKVILKKTIDNSIDFRNGSTGDFCKISVNTDRKGATLRIEDNGVGISEKVRDSVFDMFVKGNHRSKGAGLGLYLVKIATERIRGNVTLTSEEKKGSVITFTLPNLT